MSDLNGLLYELEHPAGIVTHNTMRLHKEAAGDCILDKPRNLIASRA